MMCISTLVPEGVLCTIGMSVLSSAFGLYPICTMHTVPIHKVPTYAHWPSSHPPMVGAPLCAHHTSSHQFFTIFLHPGAAMHVLNPVILLHLDAVAHLVTHSLE